MLKLKLKSHAKINFTIDILSKRDDGYHNVEMIMQSISLADRLKFIKQKSGIEIITNNPDLPTDQSNLIYKAVDILFQEYSISGGIKVELEKNIPLSAGLAGGSGNAAATLVAVNKLWKLNLSQEELLTYGAKLGADVPFCLLGGTFLATGIGTKLERLSKAPLMYLIGIKPNLAVSTAQIYNKFRLEEVRSHPQNAKVIAGLKQEGREIILENSENILEETTFRLYPQLKQLKEKVANITEQALMSGSGPTILGFVKNRKEALEAKNKLKEQLPKDYDIFVAQTVTEGIKEI